jgi:hypothetical protein
MPEPRLVFEAQHVHVDPKTGISLYGPYTHDDRSQPLLKNIIVGIVGPPNMIADAEQWLEACSGILTNDGSEPFLRPHFPGFSSDSPFKCDFVFGDTWRESIRSRDIEIAIEEEPEFDIRIKRVVDLYIGKIGVLAGRDPRPHVVICCIPQNVIDRCTNQVLRSGKPKRQRLSREERQAREDIRSGQLSLFDDMRPSLGIEDEEIGHQNLRRGLKAEAMQHGIPTQIVWPRTLSLTDRNSVQGGRKLQDLATRAWNFTTALYHKAGGSPWRLGGIDQDVCFVGISFYREILEPNPRLRTSMAQAFTSSGDGYVLRGDSFEWIASSRGRSPHLDAKSATSLIQDVLELYKNQNRGRLPGRMVIHKTSRFWDDELIGFEEACQSVPQKDFVAFGSRDIQFYRSGDYPPLRGTYIKFSDTDLALYTVGYIPYLRTYPGARVPHPLHIVEHHGDSPWNVILQEILSLTKMNWNTADFACNRPITIAFSRKVGEILAELPPDITPQPWYRFYM